MVATAATGTLVGACAYALKDGPVCTDKCFMVSCNQFYRLGKTKCFIVGGFTIQSIRSILLQKIQL